MGIKMVTSSIFMYIQEDFYIKNELIKLGIKSCHLNQKKVIK